MSMRRWGAWAAAVLAGCLWVLTLGAAPGVGEKAATGERSSHQAESEATIIVAASPVTPRQADRSVDLYWSVTAPLNGFAAPATFTLGVDRRAEACPATLAEWGADAGAGFVVLTRTLSQDVTGTTTIDAGVGSLLGAGTWRVCGYLEAADPLSGGTREWADGDAFLLPPMTRGGARPPKPRGPACTRAAARRALDASYGTLSRRVGYDLSPDEIVLLRQLCADLTGDGRVDMVVQGNWNRQVSCSAGFPWAVYVGRDGSWSIALLRFHDGPWHPRFGGHLRIRGRAVIETRRVRGAEEAFCGPSGPLAATAIRYAGGRWTARPASP